MDLAKSVSKFAGDAARSIRKQSIQGMTNAMDAAQDIIEPIKQQKTPIDSTSHTVVPANKHEDNTENDYDNNPVTSETSNLTNGESQTTFSPNRKTSTVAEPATKFRTERLVETKHSLPRVNSRANTERESRFQHKTSPKMDSVHTQTESNNRSRTSISTQEPHNSFPSIDHKKVTLYIDQNEQTESNNRSSTSIPTYESRDSFPSIDHKKVTLYIDQNEQTESNRSRTSIPPQEPRNSFPSIDHKKDTLHIDQNKQTEFYDSPNASKSAYEPFNPFLPMDDNDVTPFEDQNELPMSTTKIDPNMLINILMSLPPLVMPVPGPPLNPQLQHRTPSRTLPPPSSPPLPPPSSQPQPPPSSPPRPPPLLLPVFPVIQSANFQPVPNPPQWNMNSGPPYLRPNNCQQQPCTTIPDEYQSRRLSSPPTGPCLNNQRTHEKTTHRNAFKDGDNTSCNDRRSQRKNKDTTDQKKIFAELVRIMLQQEINRRNDHLGPCICTQSHELCCRRTKIPDQVCYQDCFSSQCGFVPKGCVPTGRIEEATKCKCREHSGKAKKTQCSTKPKQTNSFDNLPVNVSLQKQAVSSSYVCCVDDTDNETKANPASDNTKKKIKTELFKTIQVSVSHKKKRKKGRPLRLNFDINQLCNLVNRQTEPNALFVTDVGDGGQHGSLKSEVSDLKQIREDTDEKLALHTMPPNEKIQTPNQDWAKPKANERYFLQQQQKVYQDLSMLKASEESKRTRNKNTPCLSKSDRYRRVRKEYTFEECKYIGESQLRQSVTNYDGSRTKSPFNRRFEMLSKAAQKSKEIKRPQVGSSFTSKTRQYANETLGSFSSQNIDFTNVTKKLRRLSKNIESTKNEIQQSLIGVNKNKEKYQMTSTSLQEAKRARNERLNVNDDVYYNSVQNGKEIWTNKGTPRCEKSALLGLGAGVKKKVRYPYDKCLNNSKADYYIEKIITSNKNPCLVHCKQSSTVEFKGLVSKGFLDKNESRFTPTLSIKRNEDQTSDHLESDDDSSMNANTVSKIVSSKEHGSLVGTIYDNSFSASTANECNTYPTIGLTSSTTDVRQNDATRNTEEDIITADMVYHQDDDDLDTEENTDESIYEKGCCQCHQHQTITVPSKIEYWNDIQTTELEKDLEKDGHLYYGSNVSCESNKEPTKTCVGQEYLTEHNPTHCEEYTRGNKNAQRMPTSSDTNELQHSLTNKIHSPHVPTIDNADNVKEQKPVPRDKTTEMEEEPSDQSLFYPTLLSDSSSMQCHIYSSDSKCIDTNCDKYSRKHIITEHVVPLQPTQLPSRHSVSIESSKEGYRNIQEKLTTDNSFCAPQICQTQMAGCNCLNDVAYPYKYPCLICGKHSPENECPLKTNTSNDSFSTENAELYSVPSSSTTFSFGSIATSGSIPCDYKQNCSPDKIDQTKCEESFKHYQTLSKGPCGKSSKESKPLFDTSLLKYKQKCKDSPCRQRQSICAEYLDKDEQEITSNKTLRKDSKKHKQHKRFNALKHQTIMGRTRRYGATDTHSAKERHDFECVDSLKPVMVGIACNKENTFKGSGRPSSTPYIFLVSGSDREKRNMVRKCFSDTGDLFRWRNLKSGHGSWDSKTITKVERCEFTRYVSNYCSCPQSYEHTTEQVCQDLKKQTKRLLHLEMEIDHCLTGTYAMTCPHKKLLVNDCLAQAKVIHRQNCNFFQKSQFQPQLKGGKFNSDVTRNESTRCNQRSSCLPLPKRRTSIYRKQTTWNSDNMCRSAHPGNVEARESSSSSSFSCRCSSSDSIADSPSDFTIKSSKCTRSQLATSSQKIRYSTASDLFNSIDKKCSAMRNNILASISVIKSKTARGKCHSLSPTMINPEEISINKKCLTSRKNKVIR